MLGPNLISQFIEVDFPIVYINSIQYKLSHHTMAKKKRKGISFFFRIGMDISTLATNIDFTYHLMLIGMNFKYFIHIFNILTITYG